MDEDRKSGARKQVAGSIKEAIGKLIGNKQIEDAGAREKVGHPGKAQPGSSTAPDLDKPD